MSDDWSVTPWRRYDAEPTTLATLTIGDMTVTIPEPVDAEWVAQHARHGAQIIADGIIYRGTLDAAGRLDYLEVVLSGEPEDRIPFPRKRIIDAISMSLAEQGRVVDVDTTRVPTSEELASLYERGMTRQTIAAVYNREVKTIDRWTRRARAELGNRIPPPQRGPRGEQAPTNG